MVALLDKYSFFNRPEIYKSDILLTLKTGCSVTSLTICQTVTWFFTVLKNAFKNITVKQEIAFLSVFVIILKKGTSV